MYLFRTSFLLLLFGLMSMASPAFSETDSVSYYERALRQTQVEQTRATIFKKLAFYYWREGDFTNCVKYANKMLEIGEKGKDSARIGGAILFLAITSASEGHIDKALEYFIKAEKFLARNPNELGNIYLHKGNLFFYSHDFSHARPLYVKSAQLSGQAGNLKNEIAATMNIGNCYVSLDKPDSALLYYFKSLHLSSLQKDSSTYGIICMTIGDAYRVINRSMESKKFISISLRLAEKYKMTEYLPQMYFTLAGIEIGLKEFRAAKKHLLSGMRPSTFTRDMRNIMEFYKIESTTDSALGLKDSAIWDQHKYIAMSDSTHSKELFQRVAEMQTKFESDKKDNEIALLNKDKDLKAEKLKRQKFLTGLIVGGLLVFCCLSVILYRNYKAKARANQLLEVQKNEIERNRKLLAARNEKIEDSIQYAKRIQEAILPAELFTSSEVKDQFVYFMPKDIVSGDFYWRYRDGDNLFFAVVDCTGHGVPGAMMSMLGYDMLEYALVDRKLREPADILTAVNMQIIEKLYTSNPEGAKDGMDMTLCRLNLRSRVMTYSGAKNDVMLVSGNELRILAVDKNSIGFRGDTSFVQNTVSLRHGDSIYLFSDGYSDENGEATRKKYMSVRFRELLLSMRSLTFAEQKEKLHSELMMWKGNLQQRDDILIAGFRN
jgi:serine phosphatase RsbU (regulator of sigma subunit)